MKLFTFVADGPMAANSSSKHNDRSSMADKMTHSYRSLHSVASWNSLDPRDKPPYSYATMIAHAILSSERKRLPLKEIYHWISQRYPYYVPGEHGWQNSIRHNLSLNKAFVKLERSSGSTSTKGCDWALRPGYEQTFIDLLLKPTQRLHSKPRSNRKQGALFTTFRMNSPRTTNKRKERKDFEEENQPAPKRVCVAEQTVPVADDIHFSREVPLQQLQQPVQQQQQQQQQQPQEPFIFDAYWQTEVFTPGVIFGLEQGTAEILQSLGYPTATYCFRQLHN